MAKCVVVVKSFGDGSSVSGVLTLEQASEASKTSIRGQISGLSPGKHALAIHVLGDLSKAPESLGLHFNPFGKPHGAPTDEARHVGSLGNIDANEKGNAQIDIQDKVVKLIGPLSVIGRSLAVYSKEDDLAKGGQEKSMINGNAGDVIAAGVIGLSM